MTFRDRQEAAQKLSAVLLQRPRAAHPLVLGISRGGVVVGREVARALEAPLDALVVAKLGAPGQPELEVGAIAEGGAACVDADRMRTLGISPEELPLVAEIESVGLARRVALYRQGRPLPRIAGRTVILVDDGVATGATARAAIRAVRQLGPRKLVLAAPVIAASSIEAIRAEVDDLVYLEAPEPFGAVGWWYEQFPQTTDTEVLALLGRGPPDTRIQIPLELEPVVVRCEAGALHGLLSAPADAWGTVIFAHVDGSGRHERHNQHVARVLQYVGLATLLFDLLTAPEEEDEAGSAHVRFDVDLLAGRLLRATAWTDSHERLRDLPLAYFGASTGSAVALAAAARVPLRLRAIVSCGGRPDLAGSASLVRIEAPTLLIVGSRERTVLELNRQAMRFVRAERKLVVVPSATHRFEEPGTPDVVARLAAEWFAKHLLPMKPAVHAGDRQSLRD